MFFKGQKVSHLPWGRVLGLKGNQKDGDLIELCLVDGSAGMASSAG